MLNANVETTNKINKTSTNFIQNLSENREGWNTCQLVWWGHTVLMPKFVKDINKSRIKKDKVLYQKYKLLK